MIGTSILISPSGLALEAKQDAWIAAMIGIGINVGTVLLYLALGNRFSGYSLVQFCEVTLGKWLGKIVGLLFVTFFFLLASLMVGDMGFFLTSQNLPETPIEVLQMLFALAVVMTVRAGLVVYARASEIFFPWLLFLFLLLILPLIPKFDIKNFPPVLEFGIKPVLKAAFTFSGFQEVVVLLMLYPYLIREKGRGRSFLTGTIVGGAVLVMTTLGSIAVLGASLTANQLFPAYTLAKNIGIGHFLERIEGIMIFIWVLSIFIKIVITFHAAVIGFAQVTGIADEKPFIWPLAFGMVLVALLSYTNTIHTQTFLAAYWSPFSFIFTIALPLLLFLISFLHKRQAEPDIPS